MSAPVAEHPQADPTSASSSSSLYAAAARTLGRGAALYFSRPVRLFRPAKLSGWTSLRALASHHGRQVDSSFLRELVKAKGLVVIPKHFIPPLLVNAALGTVLWETYAEASSHLAHYLHPLPAAFLAGSAAGGAQALVAAPADNIRLALEGGYGGSGWSHAWKEVFRGTEPSEPISKAKTLERARRVRGWMQEVGEMAGRGWNGWGWTLAKDICGFSLFFAVFECTKNVATVTTSACRRLANSSGSRVRDNGSWIQYYSPRVAHGATLVAGGICAGLTYEWASRPFECARRLVHLDQVNTGVAHIPRHYLISIISRHIREEGIIAFFRPPYRHAHGSDNAAPARQFNTALRIIGRVGPWGMGFLMWEAFGNGLGQ